MITISNACISSQIRRILEHMSDISSILHISIDETRLLFYSIDYLEVYSMEYEIPFKYL